MSEPAKTADNKELRQILINSTQPKPFVSNSIKTARYNILTFLPFAIFNQFTNYFNIFFLFSATLLSIQIISQIGPGTSLGPFLFVLLISLIREGFEDYKKAKYDKTYNNSITLQYNNITQSFETIKWKDIKVGKIIKVLKNDVIPADLLIVYSSADNGFSYLQTTNLDGETALKPRETLIIFQELVFKEKDLFNLKGIVQIDPPDNNIYKVEGTVSIENYEKCNFDVNNILLRGGALKNVEYIYGLVVYTGKDTKIMQNIQHGSIKSSLIDNKLNVIVIYIIVVSIVICILCTILGFLFWFRGKPDYSEDQRKFEYLFYGSGNDGIFLEMMRIFTAFFTIFNTLVPISIMITLEVVKGMQVFMIHQDPDLREIPDEKLKILSMKLQEDLGSVDYIFTDKTGTLTKNEMEFRACSIFTKLYDEEKLTPSITIGGPGSIFSKNFDTTNLKESLIIDSPISIPSSEEIPFYSMKEATFEYFLNISINHNVLTEEDIKTKVKTYTGSSPDEVVLVQAAKELGIEFIERKGKYTSIKLNNQILTYEILHRFEYTSARMRSSVIIKDNNGTIKLYMKGADTIILKMINSFSNNYLYSQTKEHLDKFAKDGLRTLCYSMKILSIEELSNWEIEYRRMSHMAIIDKTLTNELDKVISQIETDTILIGVSALEDKLQDDVKEVLQDFIDAGINVWMLTGDKLDTAESIGYSCKMFNDDTEVFKIKATNDIKQLLHDVQSIWLRMEDMEEEMMVFQIEKRKRNKRKIEQPEMRIRLGTPEIRGNNSPISMVLNNRRPSSGIDRKHNQIFQFDDNIQFVGGNVKNNLITLNFMNNKPLNKLGSVESIEGEGIDDISIIKFMVDHNCFEDNKKLDNFQIFTKSKDNALVKIRRSNTPDEIREEVKNSPHEDFNLLYDHYIKKIKNQSKKKTFMNITLNERNKQRNELVMNFGIIIEGSAISLCLNKEISPYLWRILKKSRSVICCRCSPLQKAEVVKFIKKKSKSITLAIGDGGNDVSMIKSANIGVGIFGKEGYQAAYNADYAIAQFKYLKNLLFSHGRYALLRNSYFIYYYFYKNSIFTLPQFWFSFFTGFSGALFWDDWYYLGFNSFISTIPVCARALVEEDIDIKFTNEKDKTIKNINLSLIPDIYSEFRDSGPFNITKFFLVFFGGILHSLVIYFIPYMVYKFGITDNTGKTATLWDHSFLSYIILLVVQFIVIYEDSYFISLFLVLANCLQFLIIISFISIHEKLNKDQLSGKLFDIIDNVQFWLLLIITCYMSILPVLVMRRIKIHFFDNIVNNIRNRNFENDYDKKTTIRKIEEMNKYKRFLAKFKKVLQMGEDFEPDNLADKKIKDWVYAYKRRKDNLIEANHIDISKKNNNLNLKNNKLHGEWKITNNLENEHLIQNIKTIGEYQIEERLELEKLEIGQKLDIVEKLEILEKKDIIEKQQDPILERLIRKEDISKDYNEFEIDHNFSSLNKINHKDVSAPFGQLLIHPINITNTDDKED